MKARVTMKHAIIIEASRTTQQPKRAERCAIYITRHKFLLNSRILWLETSLQIFVPIKHRNNGDSTSTSLAGAIHICPWCHFHMQQQFLYKTIKFRFITEKYWKANILKWIICRIWSVHDLRPPRSIYTTSMSNSLKLLTFDVEIFLVIAYV